jgi:hypothetical protein
MMGIITKTIITFGIAGATAFIAPSASFAQRNYFQGPGAEFGLGAPYRSPYYRSPDYDWPYYYRYNRRRDRIDDRPRDRIDDRPHDRIDDRPRDRIDDRP